MPLQKTKTKLKRWFRKRRKISNDEDGWCDAVSSLSLGSSSSSSEEYFDAPEEHQTTRKRKVARRKTSANNTQKEDGKMAYQYSARPIKTIEGERKTNVLYSAKRQGSEEGLKSTGRLSTSKDCSSLPSGSGSSSSADDRVENKGGISGKQLEKLAEDLLVDFKKAISLGWNLGYNINSYYGYVKPKDSSGIISMLQDWKKKTPDMQQIPDLSKALKKAKLSHLANNFKELTQCGHVAPICQNRKVTVTLMTSSQMYTIDGLKKKLKTLKKSRPDLIDAVKVLQLPYSRIQYYEFTEDVDIMILCHSIENRRFAITNVTDSLYDEFLDYCYKTLGKEKIVVVAHDFPPEAKEVRDVKMDSFKHTQWLTFEKAGLVMICGKMDKEPEMEEEDWNSLVRFLEAASKSTPVKGDTNPPLAGKKGGKADSNKSKASNPGTSQIGSVNVVKSFQELATSSPSGSRKPSSRKPIIYICTSWGFSSVKGLQVKLQTLIKRSYSEYEVKEKELPYSRLQDFRFPKEVDEHDAIILCHSVQNRGFSITDVPNSIYDEYLQHCNKVFGKYHLAVIVHDFECTEEILRITKDTFRRTQPKTFQLAGFVALARKLDVADVQLPHDDLIQLQKFVEKL